MSRRQAVALILLAFLVIASGIVAWRVPVPLDPPAAAWNSPWIFRGEVFVGFFVGAYVVLAICATTIVRGRPPRKLSFGLLSYEDAEIEKAVDALAEGGTALQAVEAEVRDLRHKVDEGLQASRETLEALVEAAEQNEVDHVLVERARVHLLKLPVRQPSTVGTQREFDEAMARFEQILRDLEKLRAKRRGDVAG